MTTADSKGTFEGRLLWTADKYPAVAVYCAVCQHRTLPVTDCFTRECHWAWQRKGKEATN
jgi:hypothetical protein